MDSRNITIVTTANQNKYVVNTDATTLRELKSALAAQNIPYDGMTFYEGLSHTELLTDDAILPHDIPYKGNVTNELVFMLTTPNKKIRSGAGMFEARQALYDTIEEMGLKGTCQEVYGKNFTQCKNSELMSLIEAAETAKKGNVSTEEECSLKKAFRKLVNTLLDNCVICSSDADAIVTCLEDTKVPGNVYSDSEIDEMFNFLG